jgi:hypothetical protein
VSLRGTANAIRDRRLGAIAPHYFAPQTAIGKVLRRVEGSETKALIPVPLRMDEVSGKVNRCLETRSCDSLVKRDWRVVPWVMWRGSRAADEDWFLDQLFAYISSARPLSVIRALVHAYVAYFDPKRTSCHRVALFLREQALEKGTTFGQKWLQIDAKFSVFDPAVAPRSIGFHVADSANCLLALSEAGIARDAVDGELARRSFEIATDAVGLHLRQTQDQERMNRAINHLIAWNTSEAGTRRYNTPRMATKLLESLESSSASAELRDRLVRYFVKALGDPRINRAKWHNVSDRALDVAMRVLVLATLEDFFRVIDATASATYWRERREFWLGYYNAGSISDAWVAFGPAALRVAKSLKMQYGELIGATESNHSSLIVRISDFVIVEWSHMGRCRFYPQKTGWWSPGSYDKTYNFRELLAHDVPGYYATHGANWQYHFAKRIFELTGVRHPRFGGGY